MFASSLAGFALLGWLSTQIWFYTGLGVRPNLNAPNDALALLLFLLAVPVFSFFISPLFARLSRKHEFEADAYAVRRRPAASDLSTALLKLYEDNASTLTPDPVFVKFYYSHPPASERLPRSTAGLRSRSHHDRLSLQKCQARTSAMSGDAIRDHLAQLSGWREADVAIEKTFTFKDYYETISFVNALAFMCHGAGPPSRPVGALQPLRRPLQHPFRRRDLGERLRLRRQGRCPRRLPRLKVCRGRAKAGRCEPRPALAGRERGDRTRRQPRGKRSSSAIAPLAGTGDEGVIERDCANSSTGRTRSTPSPSPPTSTRCWS